MVDVRLRIRAMRTERIIVTVRVENNPHQSPVAVTPDELRIRRHRKLMDPRFVRKLKEAIGRNHRDFSRLGRHGCAD